VANNQTLKEKTMNDTLVFNDEQYRSAEQINSAMGRVYGHMSLAVIVSMLISYWVGTTPELLQFFFTGITKWLVLNCVCILLRP
jgi:FtsH-binding integral membrane protein